MKIAVKILWHPSFRSITEHRKVFIGKKLETWALEPDALWLNPSSYECGSIVLHFCVSLYIFGKWEWLYSTYLIDHWHNAYKALHMMTGTVSSTEKVLFLLSKAGSRG